MFERAASSCTGSLGVRFCQLEAAAAAVQHKFKKCWQRIITRMQLLYETHLYARAVRQTGLQGRLRQQLARALPLARHLTERLKTRYETLSGFALTFRRKRGPRRSRVDLAKRETRAPRGVALDIAAPHDHSDQRIDVDARESHSKPHERPKFSSPHFMLFGADSRADLLGLEMSGAARELRRRSTGRLRGSANSANRPKRA